MKLYNWNKCEKEAHQALLCVTCLRFTKKLQLLVFAYHVIKPKNRNHSINKVTNKQYDR